MFVLSSCGFPKIFGNKFKNLKYKPADDMDKKSSYQEY